MPLDGPWRTATATGPTSVAANVATTAALVLGEDAVPWLEERGVDARLVDRDGRVVRTGRWPAEAEPTHPLPTHDLDDLDHLDDLDDLSKDDA